MTPDSPPDLGREEVKRLIDAHVPVTYERFPTVDMKTALAAQASLIQQKSAIPKYIRDQGEEILKQWQRVLEPIPGHPGKYVISDDLLRGLIARAGITAGMLALLASGAAIVRQREISEIEKLLTPDDELATDDGLRGVDEVAPPAV